MRLGCGSLRLGAPAPVRPLLYVLTDSGREMLLNYKAAGVLAAGDSTAVAVTFMDAGVVSETSDFVTVEI